LKFALIFSSDLDTFYEILRLLEKRGGTVHYRRGPFEGYFYVLIYPASTDKTRMLREVARLIRG
jgi:hypothetical protein